MNELGDHVVAVWQRAGDSVVSDSENDQLLASIYCLLNKHGKYSDLLLVYRRIVHRIIQHYWRDDLQESQASVEVFRDVVDRFGATLTWLSNLFFYLDNYQTSLGHRSLYLEGKEQFQNLVFDKHYKERVGFFVAERLRNERLEESPTTQTTHSYLRILRDFSDDAERPIYKYVVLPWLRELYPWLRDHWSLTPEDDGVDYLRRASDYISAEIVRIELYELGLTAQVQFRVLATTELLVRPLPRLLDTWVEVLLKDDRAAIRSFFQRMHSTAPTLTDELARRFREFVAPSVTAATIDDNITLYSKYEEMVRVDFHSNGAMLNVFLDVFRACIAPASSMAKYMDSLIGKEAEAEEEAARKLRVVVAMTLLLPDKDVFVETYRQQLSKRLLRSLRPGKCSSSIELEKDVIGWMKEIHGQSFVSKLEGMVRDFAVGVGGGAGGCLQVVPGGESRGTVIDFSAVVLSMGHWPSFLLFPTIRLPESVRRCTENIEMQVAQLTNKSRRLTWVHSQGYVEVRMFPSSSSTRFHMLQLVPIQATVLMLFDSGGGSGDGTEDVQSVMAKTGLPEDAVKKALFSLSQPKTQVLVKEEQGGSYRVNTAFEHKSRMISIPMPLLASEKAKEEEGVARIVEMDRGLAIQSAIVRVMKSCGQKKHRDLIADVMTQVKSKFEPEPAIIKKNIEMLIEREYMARDSADANLYVYIA